MGWNRQARKTTFSAWTLIAAVALALGMAVSSGAGVAWAKGEPQADDPFADAAQVDVDDGRYLVDVVMEGGTGRADIASPVQLEVKDGLAVATVVWSSSNYDYMVVAGKQYLPSSVEGGSPFTIPVTAFDEPMEIVGDTTAMSEPHEIDYTLTFDADSIRKEGAVASGMDLVSSPALPIALIVIACIVVGILLVRGRRA